VVTLLDPSGRTRVVVERTGATIASIEAGGTELLWRAPWAGEEWDDGNPARDSHAEFHARYPGGWHTLLPNAGDAFDVDGVAHPFHGEACRRPWRIVESGASFCTLRVVLRTSPLVVRRRVDAVADGVLVTQEVTSYGADPVAFTWVEHPAFGPALVRPGSSVTVGGRPLDLVIPGPDATHAAMTVVDAATARITSPSGGLTAELRFDTRVFPLVQVWQEHRAQRGFPWWGVVDTLAVEPSAAAYGARSEGDPLGPLTLAPGGRLAAKLHLRVETR
jgi:galactose mutarotase-like enzyme